jgi:alkylhydroperoxidase family enzyme
MQERLQPIEQPKGLMMKLAYVYSKKQFGKVLTPLKLAWSRMPLAFSFWNAKIHKLEKLLKLDPQLVLMLRIKVAQLNTCTFCMDIGKAMAVKSFGNSRKFYELEHFEGSSLYTEAEKAALRFATELTVHHKIPDSVYSTAAQHFTDRELIEITWVIGSEHVYNITNVAFNIESDNLCALPSGKRAAQVSA